MARKTVNRLLQLLCIPALIASCGDSGHGADGATTVERRSDSFLDDYLAALPDKPAPTRLPVDGHWYGLAFCPSGVFPVTIDVTGEQALITIGAAIGDRRRKTPFHHEHTQREATAGYQPHIQRLSVLTRSNPGDDLRDLRLELLLVPDAADRALMSVSELYGRNVRTCHTALAGRGGEADQVLAFTRRLATIKADRRPVFQVECPAEYAQWLAEHAGDAKAALVDERFAAVFGEPYLQLPAEELLQISALLSGSCVAADDRRNGFGQTRLAAALRSDKSYQATYSTDFREPLVQGWRAWADARLAGGDIRDGGVLTQLSATPSALGLREHPALAGFNETVQREAGLAQAAAATLAAVEQIEAHRDDFRRLLAIALLAESRGDVDIDVVRRGLDYYLADAAATYAATVTEIEDAAYLAAWTGQQAAGQCPASDSAVCAAAADAINLRLARLADAYAEREEDQYRALLAADSGPPRLAAMVSFEREFQTRYAGLSAQEAFREGIEERADDRRELQSALEDELTGLIETARTTTELRALRNDYFLDEDLADLEELAAALDRRMQTRRPFAKLPGAAYLNALYNRDYAALSQLDRQNLAGITPLVRFGAAQLAELGPLFDTMLGRQPGSSAREASLAAANLTALYAVIGTYLVEYQDAYADCLEPNARVFTITRRTDLVTTDGFGNEISRNEGWTTRDSYQINPEFASQFDALFNTATGSSRAQLLDLLLNDSRIAVLRLGTRRVMADFDCDAAEVRQLEQGMLAYDREVRRRARVQ